MNKSKCPHCDFKLGQFLYADACPSCHLELAHNTMILTPVAARKAQQERGWPMRRFLRVVRFVES